MQVTLKRVIFSGLIFIPHIFPRSVINTATISASRISQKKFFDHLEQRFCQRFTWQAMCDFAYANDSDGPTNEFYNQTPFDPAAVFPGSTIFVTSQTVRSFFKKVHPKIRSSYILVIYL